MFMKRLWAGTLVFLMLMLCACGQATLVEKSEAETTTAATNAPTTTKLPEAKSNWKEAYTEFLLHHYEGVHGYITLGLADFDKSGTPELIILDDSMGSLGGAFSIVAYQNKQAELLFSSGTSSSYVISKDGKELCFFRNFDSLHSSGGTYGYGYVTKLISINGVFSCTPLLQVKIADFSFEDDETLRTLAWEMSVGEASLLKSKEFGQFVSIQKSNADDEWQDISADDYLRLKKSYLGDNPKEYRGHERGDPFALPEIRHEFYDLSSDNPDDYNGRMPTEHELGTFFARWSEA
jgi:hypothetical protein